MLTWQEAVVDAKVGRLGVHANEGHLLEKVGPVIEEGLLVALVQLQHKANSWQSHSSRSAE